MLKIFTLNIYSGENLFICSGEKYYSGEKRIRKKREMKFVTMR
ncbi:MAG TPA: hypothetical protein P5543_11410 [Planctomycetota bacterium]|nr:hypothetical protein [Planctomycetota bacterium]